MTTSRSDKLGSVVVPVTAGAPGVSLATTCDPAVTSLLAAFKAIANTKLNAAWRAASGLIAGATGNVIEDTYPHEVTSGIVQRTWTGPALFMWRERERLFERTQSYDDAECSGKALYVLPALTEENLVKLEPIRVALRTCLQLSVKHFGDPSYRSGTDILSAAGVESFAFVGAEYTRLPAASGIEMYHSALMLDWSMRECESFVLTQYETLTQIETTVTSNDDSGGETTVLEAQFPIPTP